MISVSLPPELEKRLQNYCDAGGISLEEGVNQALEYYLETYEEKLLARAAYKDYLNSGEKGISLEALKKKYQF